ncbi:hypothetical protein B0H14DRAFT_3544687 [Mycena olivaceomarginata]|nr:hypothetical protein B0H14DRAFT_3544687 [Mycena olivaceomarginata]
MTHYRWLVYFYCELHSVYDADTCASMYAKLPECLDLIMSLQDTGFSARANAARRAARETCRDHLRQCANQSLECFPLFTWIERYMRDSTVSRTLSIPSFINYTALSDPVEEAFSATGDHMLATHLMYEPLLARGIRILRRTLPMCGVLLTQWTIVQYEHRGKGILPLQCFCRMQRHLQRQYCGSLRQLNLQHMLSSLVLS